ncbi:MAG: hypothetical protein K2Q26_14735 [Bdellovibrionales bacterium]|nr:hypothetical protein [Bdellovibrionales bacterium]
MDKNIVVHIVELMFVSEIAELSSAVMLQLFEEKRAVVEDKKIIAVAKYF